MTEFIAVLSGLIYFALHLAGNSFPRPLSAREEAECLKRIREGDAGAKSALVEHNLRLVAHVIKKYYASAEDQDDLISIGTIGLIKAVNTFDSGKGSRFATYAARCIENEILMHFRAKKKTAQDVYISDPIDTDRDGNSLTLIDVIADNSSIFDAIELKLRCEKLRVLIEERLDEREREIVILRYGLSGRAPMAQREAAALLGISRSYVSRIEKKALEKLRLALENER